LLLFAYTNYKCFLIVHSLDLLPCGNTYDNIHILSKRPPLFFDQSKGMENMSGDAEWPSGSYDYACSDD